MVPWGNELEKLAPDLFELIWGAKMISSQSMLIFCSFPGPINEFKSPYQ